MKRGKKKAERLPAGFAIAKRDIPCWKVFKYRWERRVTGLMYGNWGRLYPGKVLRQKAKRTSEDCAQGIHVYPEAGIARRHVMNWSIDKDLFKSAHGYGSVRGIAAWKCVIPKGTAYHAAGNQTIWKFRADKILLVNLVSVEIANLAAAKALGVDLKKAREILGLMKRVNVRTKKRRK